MAWGISPCESVTIPVSYTAKTGQAQTRIRLIPFLRAARLDICDRPAQSCIITTRRSSGKYNSPLTTMGHSDPWNRATIQRAGLCISDQYIWNLLVHEATYSAADLRSEMSGITRVDW